MNRTEAEQAVRGSGVTAATAHTLVDIATFMGTAVAANSTLITYSPARGYHVDTMTAVAAVTG